MCEDVGERLAPHGKLVEPEVVGGSDSEVGDAWCMKQEDSSEEEEKIEEEIEWRSGMMVREHRREQMKRWKWKMRGHSGKESESESEDEEMKMRWSLALNQPSFERRTE
ncbi:Microfibrillar-associated protein 1 [Myotis davidii]|uniref:Microfibrillar-associated protein 1 n=1 Tax=Myotis davidii TaxID=225400 RepID=L5LML4_MYODS|nr:Microfibrillar-associated protein 1 [Myotis davidii]